MKVRKKKLFLSLSLSGNSTLLRSPHSHPQLLRSCPGDMLEEKAAFVSRCEREETPGTRRVFSIFKVPSLLLRDATGGEGGSESYSLTLRSVSTTVYFNI